MVHRQEANLCLDSTLGQLKLVVPHPYLSVMAFSLIIFDQLNLNLFLGLKA